MKALIKLLIYLFVLAKANMALILGPQHATKKCSAFVSGTYTFRSFFVVFFRLFSCTCQILLQHG